MGSIVKHEETLTAQGGSLISHRKLRLLVTSHSETADQLVMLPNP